MTAILMSCIAGASAVISSCHDQTKLDPRQEAELQEIRATHPGMTEKCVKDMRSGGPIVMLFDPDCYEMLPDQRWTGLWNTGWEWSNFCPDPATKCPTPSERGGIWMEFGKSASTRLSGLPDGVYRIDFVGRRTKVAGHFGHQDAYDHLIIVDRVVSIMRIPGEKYTKRF